ncbi:MAG: hypothetical protein QXM75_04250 [Candidatus Diapherotrites archaeon]
MQKKLITKAEIPIFNLGLSRLLESKKIFLLVTIQLMLLTGLVFFLYKIIEPSFARQQLTFSDEIPPYINVLLILLSLFLIDRYLKRKKSTFYFLQLAGGNYLKNTIKQKIKSQKDNQFGLALVILELLFVALIASSIDVYLSLKSSNTAQIVDEPNLQRVLSFLANIFIFSAILAFIIWLHKYAKSFDSIKFKGKKAIRIFSKKD